MVQIKFYPDCDKTESLEAVNEYQGIWDKEGERIINAIEARSGLKFVENYINAIVFEGVSHSEPLSLRASYTYEVKKGTIVHELLHRLLSGNKVIPVAENKREQALVSHKQLNLILYDIWAELYGEEFAKNNVEVEADRADVYKEAWKWALSFEKVERSEKFKTSMRDKTI